nr:type II toxin-antitoxin system RelE/ParE family toxin [Algoriphagus oliviformis]
MIIKPDAENDIREIFEWYESKALGLGEHFLNDLESKLEKMTSEPEVYQFHHMDFRFAFLDKFPVSVHFKLENKTIYVFGVFPTSRNPKSWRKG